MKKGTALLKKPSVTQDQNTRVMENSIIHVERSEKSINTRDWASLSIWVTEFSVTLVLWSCVTLGFSNSAVCFSFLDIFCGKRHESKFKRAMQ
jgi:hypothetical protein